jgi:hypothetical protein
VEKTKWGFAIIERKSIISHHKNLIN